MKAVTKVVKKQILILDEKEADWLKGMCQHPLREDESPEHEEMRYRLFSSLKWSYEIKY